MTSHPLVPRWHALSSEVKSLPLPLNQADCMGHCFCSAKCALGKLIVRWMMWLFWDIILCRGIGDTASYCSHGVVRAQVIARCRCASAKISLSAHAQFQNDRKNWSGQNRTSRIACYGHVLRQTDRKTDRQTDR